LLPFAAQIHLKIPLTMTDYMYGRRGSRRPSGQANENYYRRGRYEDRQSYGGDMDHRHSSYGGSDDDARFGSRDAYSNRKGSYQGDEYSGNFSGSNYDRDFDFGLNRRGRESQYGQYGNMDYRDNPANIGAGSNYRYNRGGYGSNFGGEYGHYSDEFSGGRPADRYRGWAYGNPDEREYSSYSGRYDHQYEQAWKRDNRDWFDRAGDEVASWFGDKDAEHRRRIDHYREQHRGKGPKGYRRSDGRIEEDVNDRLSYDSWVDASDIEVKVSSGEVTLTGTVYDRFAKRRAEDIAESIPGVTNVENRIRVSQSPNAGVNPTYRSSDGYTASSMDSTRARTSS
jgi:osmotically-inducible protein OsmY